MDSGSVFLSVAMLVIGVVMQIEGFILKDKFLEDSSGNYPEISNPKLRKPLTDIINRSAEEFIDVLTDEPSDIKFRNTVKMGLEKFERYKRSLDSRDKDRIVNYYKELMDLVGWMILMDNWKDGVMNLYYNISGFYDCRYT